MAKKTSSTNERKRRLQEKVLEVLAESGNISYACKRAGISRETYYAWREDRVFGFNADKAVENGKAFVNDLAHTQLIRNIQDGNFGAVRFQLTSCHPDYQPRKPRPTETMTPVDHIEITIAEPRSGSDQLPLKQ